MADVRVGVLLLLLESFHLAIPPSATQVKSLHILCMWNSLEYFTDILKTCRTDVKKIMHEKLSVTHESCSKYRIFGRDTGFENIILMFSSGTRDRFFRTQLDCVSIVHYGLHIIRYSCQTIYVCHVTIRNRAADLNTASGYRINILINYIYYNI